MLKRIREEYVQQDYSDYINLTIDQILPLCQSKGYDILCSYLQYNQSVDILEKVFNTIHDLPPTVECCRTISYVVYLLMIHEANQQIILHKYLPIANSFIDAASK